MTDEPQQSYIIGDCRKLLKGLCDNSIDLVVTSPPYNVNKNYGETCLDSLAWDDYWKMMLEVITEIHRVLKPGGRVCWNVLMNAKRNDGVRINLMQAFKNLFDALFVDMGDILWIERTLSKRTAWGSWCSPSSPYIQMPAECVLVYAKDTVKKKGGKGDIKPAEFMEWITGMWFFNNAAIDGHPAPFPVELPLRCIKLFSYVGDVVLDPFVGSGTTLLACRMTSRTGIGFEINPDYEKLIQLRMHHGTPVIESWLV